MNKIQVWKITSGDGFTGEHTSCYFGSLKEVIAKHDQIQDMRAADHKIRFPILKAELLCEVDA